MNPFFKGLLALMVSGSFASEAALFDSGFANDGVIPDANPTGWSDTRLLSGLGSQITDVSVRLQFSEGYNGDLYAYLSHDGVLIPLLNRVGTGTGTSTDTTYNFGFSTAGMNVTLSDGGSANIHDVNASSGGTWLPDGRLADPSAGAGAITASGQVGFSVFNGMNPNGSWTLFFADLSGGSQSKMQAWELEVTAVPEPVNVALGAFGVLFCLGMVWRRIRGGRGTI